MDRNVREVMDLVGKYEGCSNEHSNKICTKMMKVLPLSHVFIIQIVIVYIQLIIIQII